MADVQKILNRINAAIQDNLEETNEKNLAEIAREIAETCSIRQEEEIDLIAPGQNITFFGEAKWRNEPMKADVIQELERKSLLIPASKRYYLLLSKSGYAQSARQYADGRTDIQFS